MGSSIKCFFRKQELIERLTFRDFCESRGTPCQHIKQITPFLLCECLLKMQKNIHLFMMELNCLVRFKCSFCNSVINVYMLSIKEKKYRKPTIPFYNLPTWIYHPKVYIELSNFTTKTGKKEGTKYTKN